MTYSKAHTLSFLLAGIGLWMLLEHTLYLMQANSVDEEDFRPPLHAPPVEGGAFLPEWQAPFP